MRINPQLASAAISLVVCLRDVGRPEEAAEIEQFVLNVEPENQTLYGNRLFHLYFDPGQDARSIYQEHARWNERFAAELTRAAKPHANDPTPTRRLRIGYVSPDFRRHCQTYFTVPLLSNHDHKAFEIFCYASVLDPDQNTANFRTYADVWRDCVTKSDEEIAEMVRADGIDVLVDLTMHMAFGRPLLFAPSRRRFRSPGWRIPGRRG